MSDDAFYLERIPQSVYRNTSGRKTEYQKLDTELPKLKIKEKKLKDELIDRIEKESSRIIEALLPEEKWEEAKASPLVDYICKELGLK